MPLQEAETRVYPAPAARGGIRPLFAVGGLYSKANGVAWIMKGLAEALGRQGSPVSVCAAECFGRPSIGEMFGPPSRWLSARGLWLGGLSWSPGLKPIMRRAVAEADVIHNHSVWMLPNSYASRTAARLGKPVVFTAHGTLEPWALQHSGWKKRLVGAMFQWRDLERAACIHVNSAAEMVGVRALGLTNPIAVVPNGVDLPASELLADRAAFRRAYPEIGDKRIVLFLSRLHVKKGLGHLIEAWSRVAGRYGGWHLVIAGPDNGFEATAREMVERAGLGRSVTFTGNLQGRQKAEALSAAEFFVLPSFSEGFSMAVLEAMAARLPVLITPGCNFAQASDAGAAVSVQPTVDGTEAGLVGLMSMDPAAARAMGRAGRELVEARYTWDAVARDMLGLYGWLADQSPRPPFVHS